GLVKRNRISRCRARWLRADLAGGRLPLSTEACLPAVPERFHLARDTFPPAVRRHLIRRRHSRENRAFAVLLCRRCALLHRARLARWRIAPDPDADARLWHVRPSECCAPSRRATLAAHSAAPRHGPAPWQRRCRALLEFRPIFPETAPLGCHPSA